MVCGTFLVPFDAERTRITEWQGNLPSTEPFPNANEVPPTIKTFVYFPEKSACDSTGAHSVTPRRAEKNKMHFLVSTIRREKICNRIQHFCKCNQRTWLIDSPLILVPSSSQPLKVSERALDGPSLRQLSNVCSRTHFKRGIEMQI